MKGVIPLHMVLSESGTPLYVRDSQTHACQQRKELQ